MQPGTLVKLPDYRRYWVAVRITQQDINRGIQARKPGVYLMSGMWYGTNPTDARSHGKLLACTVRHRVVGKVANKHVTGARRSKFT